MKMRISHHPIITTTLFACSLGLAPTQSFAQRQIDPEFLGMSGNCDIDCKSSVSQNTHTNKDWLSVGLSLIKKDDYAAASYALKKAVAVANKTKDQTHSPRALVELGGIAYAQKNFTQAADYYKRAIDIAEQSNDIVNGATAALNFGLVQRRMGNKAEARKMFRKSLAFTRGTKARSLRVNAMFQYGRILKEQNNIKWAQKALGKAKRLSQKYALAHLYQASTQELNSLQIAQKETRTRRVATAIVRTSSPAKQISSQKPTNVTSLTKVATTAPTGQSSWVMRDEDMANTYDKLGATHMQNRQYDMASDMFRNSIFLNKKLKNTVAQAKGHQNMAKIYIKLGDHKHSCLNLWEARVLMNKAQKRQDALQLTNQLQNHNCLMQQAALD